MNSKIFSYKISDNHKVFTLFGIKIKMKLPYLNRFEVHITDHCNLNCKGCSHFCPVADEKYVDVEQFRKDFQCLSQKIDVGTIRLLGGEPLLHKDLPELMQIAREAFPHSAINICTNGILLPTMDDEFWNTAKRYDIKIDMSKYPPLADKFDSYINLIKEKSNQLGDINDIEDFAYVLNKKGDSDYKRTFDKCKNKYKAHANLNNGMFYICGRCYLTYFNKYFNTNLPIDNGINIYEHSGKEIVKFLNTPQKLCSFCYEDRPTFKWGISKKEKAEWLKAD